MHLIHLVYYRASCGNVALAGLHHDLLTHPDGGLPKGDVGKGCPHGASSHLHLQLHAAPEALFLGVEVALLKGWPTLLHSTACILRGRLRIRCKLFATRIVDIKKNVVTCSMVMRTKRRVVQKSRVDHSQPAWDPAVIHIAWKQRGTSGVNGCRR